MKIRWEDIPTLAALGAVVKEVLNNGYAVRLTNEVGYVTLVAHPISEPLETEQPRWIKLQPANSPEGLISDYSISVDDDWAVTIEDCMNAADQLID